MTEDRHERLAEWFEEASRLSGAELDAWFTAREGEDGELAAEIRELLDHDTRAQDGALEGGLDSGGAAALAAEVLAGAVPDSGGEALEPGARVGPYTVRGRLGVGGFAAVYRADQREPVTRDVALKVLRPGMDSQQVLSRFAAELQAQARMGHDHVARVYDAGTTDEGRPYLAMELVEGRPIHAWCDERGLDVAARLDLFLQACDAVQHAHQKGVVHRDLKPSNVLVADGGAHGSVKIIDFGIAKAIEGSLTDDTLRTLEGQLVGTPEFMSPEQARGSASGDVDTRADVYALGVVLYELLAGARPFDFAGVPLVEVQRTILEVDPPRPSTRAGANGGVPSRDVRGDLDWIVLRALEKDPGRRYPTVAALAADVERYLRDEPVEASPPSASYRARKFVRRNRAVVVATALVIASLASGLVWALAERDRANEAAAAESLAKQEAQQRADDLEAVSGFQAGQMVAIDRARMGASIRRRVLAEAEAAMRRELRSSAEIEARRAELEDLLRGANFTDIATDALHEDIVEPSIESMREQFADQPVVEAELMHSAGTTLSNMARYADSRAAYERAVALRTEHLGEDHADTLWSRILLANTLRLQGDVGASRAELDDVIPRLQASDDPAVRTHLAYAVAGLADLAGDEGDRDERLERSREAYELARAQYGDDSDDALILRGMYAGALGLRDGAEEVHKEVIEAFTRVLGPEHERTLVAEEGYASFLSATGRTREAMEIRLRTSEAFRRVAGDRDSSTFVSIGRLGLMYFDQQRFDEAERLLRETYEGELALLGPDNPNTLGAANNLGMVLQYMDRDDEAIELLESALAGQRATLGAEHMGTLGSMTNLGISLMNVGRLDDAAAILEDSLDTKMRVLGPEHPFTQICLERLAQVYEAQGQVDDAIALWSDLIDLRVARAEAPRATAEEVGHAAELLFTVPRPELRDLERALPLAEKAVALEREYGGSMLHVQLSRLAVVQAELGDVDAALATQEEALAVAHEGAKPLMQSYLDDYRAQIARREAKEGTDGL